MTSYVALLRKEQGTGYGVEFPNFPGCVTAGKSLDEARKIAAEALELHIEDSEAIPEPASLDHIMAEAVLF
jgi:predicted RNase H-like HicB family nuclease